MKIKNKITITFIALSILIFFVAKFYISWPTPTAIEETSNSLLSSTTSNSPITSFPASLPLVNKEKIQYQIPKDNGIDTTLEINSIKYIGKINQKTSVYDFMKKLMEEKEVTFTEKNYSGIGKFIISLNGVSGDKDHAWIYYVNGNEASLGVSTQIINPGDVVSWKYEKPIY